MGKFEVLIQHYCPDGVKFVPLGSIAVLSRGKVISKDYIKDNGGDYPVYSSQSENDGVLGRINTYMYEGKYLTWTTDGAYAGTVFRRSGKFNITNVCGLVDVSDQNVNLDFLYYWLYAEAPKYVYRGMGNPKLMSNVMGTISVPIPPLPVQEEIVRVLDTFTELQAELQAELQKRLQQYNYYRDNLLSFEGRTDVEWVTIEQLFHRKNGYTPSKANPDFWTNGTIPWFRMEDIRENGRILTNSIQKVHPSAVKKSSLVRAGSIILATSATIGEHALVNVDCLTNQRFTCLTVKEDYSHKVDIKFIFYYMFKVDEWCRTHTVQGNFPGVDMSLFPNVSIPLPTLDEQKRIASILDRFDALTTDLTAGLPAEIEKRRQQYEFYRDKLLTFKRKEA